ncbi:hypothetical protein RRG08_031195 [Elysia crispata]|uniref:Uncharacterized protein n=1 Tax=Elysia crispata TaxID=231223 RepID=A0AAE0XMQ5_9GAST|nr:hypothetical protein RRG08_031195 [Elysia crispata]
MLQFCLFGKRVRIMVPRSGPPPVENSPGVFWENVTNTTAHAPVYANHMTLRRWLETSILRFRPQPSRERRIVLERPTRKAQLTLDNVNNTLIVTPWSTQERTLVNQER